jgi:hypothetical protein
MLNIIQILVLIAGFTAVCYCITHQKTSCKRTDLTSTPVFSTPEPSLNIPVALVYTPDAELQADQDAEDLLKRINQAPIVRI